MCEDCTKELYEKLDKIIEEHKDMPGPTIQVLHAAQNLCGYLPKDVLCYVAEKLDRPCSEVYGVATFYHLFHMKPKGKYQFKVCLGTACYIRGGKMICDVIKETLGLDLGEVSEDRNFSVEAVRCIGACGLAPVMMVNDTVYDRLISPARVKAVVNEYRTRVAEEQKATA